MPIKIGQSTLKKLSHENEEIRLRSLEQIESKVTRAITLNEDIEFHPGALIKYLIRWFGYHPIIVPDKVIHLISIIFQSQYASNAIEVLGIDRLKREFSKIQTLLKPTQQQIELLVYIQAILDNYSTIKSNKIEIIDCDSITDSSNDNIESDNQICSEDFETPWSKPSTSDINAMKQIADVLKGTESSPAELQKVLQHLQITLPDYPPEYLLQYPNIFQYLINLYNLSDSICPFEDITDTLYIFVRLLLIRIKLRQKPAIFLKPNDDSQGQTQMSLTKVCCLMLELLINYIVDNVLHVNNGCVQAYMLINLILQIVEKLSINEKLEIQKKFIPTLDLLVKNLRLTFEKDKQAILNRLNYLHILFINTNIMEVNASSAFEIEKYKEATNSNSLMTEAKYSNGVITQKVCAAASSNDFMTNNLNTATSSSSIITQEDLNENEVTMTRILTKQTNSNTIMTQKVSNEITNHNLKEATISNNLIFPNLKKATSSSSIMTQQSSNKIMTQKQNELTNSNQIITQELKKASNSSTIQDLIESTILGETTNHELKEAIIDLPLAEYFPEQYKAIQNKLSLNSEFEILLNSKEFLIDAINILKDPDGFSPQDILQKSSKIISTLAVHKSLKLVKKLYSSILTCVPMYEGNKELYATAINVIQILLTQENEIIKEYIYTKIASDMKKYFACLMNGENAFPFIDNMKLIELNIIGVPLHCNILKEIICFGYQNKNETIQRCSEDILSLLLRGKNLFSNKWIHFLQILLPVLPLLQNLTRSNKITDLLIKLLDPDEKNIPTHEILEGNLRFLFHPQTEIRSEALSRLIYILTSTESESSIYSPNIMEIRDLLPNDLCIQRVPRDVDRIFSGAISDRLTVTNLLYLLNTNNIEPLIRKTTLIQLNVMCQDEEMNRIAFDKGSYFYVLKALDNSLQKSSHTDYTDTAIPAVGILSKILLCDSDFRLELSKEYNIYNLLLRLLFLYPNDITVKQDASICLFLLLYSSCIIGNNQHIEIPRILANFKLPVKCNLQTERFSHNAQNKLEKIYYSKEHEVDKNTLTRFFRIQVGSIYCNGIRNINKTSIQNLKTIDINENLYLTKADVALIRATSVTENIERCLKTITNATEHQTLIQSTIYLKSNIYLSETITNFHMDEEKLIKIYRKYIEMPPNNELEFSLFENVLDLMEVCIQVNKIKVILWLFGAVNDFQHPLITLLASFEIPLRLYHKIARVIVNVLNCSNENSSDALFYCSLFEYLLPTIEDNFEKRELNRVRCLLEIMHSLSSHQLNLNEKSILRICKKFLNISISLKSFTQTGSNCQKKCLLIIGNLCSQMPSTELQLSGSYIKYISGLCGHNDYQVKCLAWCMLGSIAGTSSGCSKLTEELSFLPGGFAACCLSTLLDINEMPIVRQFAGNLFVDLIRNGPKENIFEIIEKHNFYNSAYSALADFTQNDIKLTECKYTKVTTCDIVRCFARICIQILDLNQSYIEDLCDMHLMSKLYSLIKVHDASEVTGSFFSMAAEICCLYSRCYPNRFIFLKRTICRDQVFIFGLTSLIDDRNIYDDSEVVKITNLLLVLCKDGTAFNYICESFDVNRDKITKFLTSSIEISLVDSHRQKNILAFITFLLIKSQQKGVHEHITFLQILEDTTITSEILFNKMLKLFQFLYSKDLKLELPPTQTKILLCEALAVLLKTSQKAKDAAYNLKFIDVIINAFNTLLDNFKILPTMFIRRYGEGKKEPVVHNLQLIINIILNWYSPNSTVLCEERIIEKITKVFLKMWPWVSLSYDLKIIVFRTLTFLSERSSIVCKIFSTTITPYTCSILQNVEKVVTSETMKIKVGTSAQHSLVEAGIRFLMNCCYVCQQARIALIKLHTFNVFDNMLCLKNQKFKSNVLIMWLQFWEVFSRYTEGAQCHNLNALCNLINKSNDTQIRILGLQILRNMSFLTTNRIILFTSREYMCTVYEILSNFKNNLNHKETLVVCTSLWKLISGGIKYSTKIKNTKITHKLKLIDDHLQNHDQGNELVAKDLSKVIEIILEILQN